MRYVIVMFWMLFWSVTSAVAQISIGIGLPGVSIGINLPLYPELERVPGYPVYYAPRLSSNYFFYDGMYWVYQGDNWYASSWYNGPWGRVAPYAVPYYVLRIPVRYYRQPPERFRGWRPDAPPRWGEHWGREWEQRRSGWDRWDPRSAPAPAPLPTYQRQYSGDRYPRVEEQPVLHGQNYRYQPRSAAARQHYEERAVQRAPAPPQRGQPQQTSPRPQAGDRSTPPPPLQKGGPADPRSQPPQGAAQRQQQAPRSSQENIPQSKGASQETRREQGQEKDREKQVKGTPQAPRPGQVQAKKDREKGDERGQERNR